MTVRVRPAEPADFDAIAQLTVEAYRADGQLADEAGYERNLRDVARRAEAGMVLTAVDEDTGAILGAVTFVLPGSRYAELSSEGEAEFRMLAVDPAAQGRGVARALVDACLHRAAELGCSAVVICSRDFATRAHRLYERIGFVRTPERDWFPSPDVRLVAFRYPLSRAADGGPADEGNPAA